MFVKYVIDKTATDTQAAHDAVWSDIAGILNGTITAPAQCTSPMCNTGVTTMTGVANSAIYTNLVYDNATSKNTIKFEKNHYNNGAGYAPLTNAQFQWQHGLYPTFRTWAKNDDPTVDVNLYWPGVLSNNDWGQDTNYIATTSALGIDEILLVVSDYWFVIQLKGGDNASTAIVMDYEDTSADQYAYNVNNNCSPQYGWITDLSNITDGASSGMDFMFGRHHYLSRNGYLKTRTDVSDGYSIGNFGNAESTYFPQTTAASIYPQPRIPQSSVPLTAGQGHLLTPIFIVPCVGGTTEGSTLSGKIPHFYRTSDGLTTSGDIITHDGVDYVIVIIHKAGLSNGGTANACYALPKLIGGF